MLINWKKLLFFIFCLGCGSVWAIQTNSLEIELKDINGDFVVNALITIKTIDNKIIETTQAKNKLTHISNLAEGNYIVEITAENFKPYLREIEIKNGTKRILIVLKIADIVENVTIGKTAREKRLSNPLGGNLTQEEIQSLPETSEEIEDELRRRYGDNLVIRVDGKEGKAPNKSRIASIKVVLSSYDAQNHELGFVYVDITTKIGNQSWSGQATFLFNDESLNSRNPLSENRLPKQDKEVLFSLFGPLKSNESIIFLEFVRNNKTGKENIIAVLPEGNIDNQVITSYKQTGFRGGLFQNLENGHIIRATYDFTHKNNENLGVGNFNLPEQAYSINSTNHQFRLSESGYLSNRYFNEFHFEYNYGRNETTPESLESAIIVSDAFTSGGAGNENRNNYQKLSFSDNLLFGVGKNALKIGGLVEFEKFSQTSRENENGTFIFPSLNDFQANTPSLFTQISGERNIDFWQTQISGFIQNDYAVKPGLNIGMGLRYEWQNQLTDNNNFSPRLSFTWSPYKSGKLTFRGGAGVFYNWLETNTSASVFSQDITQPSEIVVINPDFFNPLSGGTGQTLPQSFRKFADDLKNPYVIHTSLGANFSLNRNFSLSANYVYQKGVHQFRSRNVNAPLEGTRPNPNLGNIIQVESSGFFVRNKLEVFLNTRFLKRISVNVRYNLEKTTSDSDGIFQLPSDNYNLRNDISYSNNDRRHGIYSDINWFIGNSMNLNLRYSILSPLPYSIFTGFDNNGDTHFNDRPFRVFRNSERGTWQNYLDTGFSWMYSFHDLKEKRAGREAGGQSQSDITRGSRRTAKNKKFSLRFFISAKNLLNQTNFTTFSGVQTSPFFRQPIAVRDSRRIDAGVSFRF